MERNSAQHTDLEIPFNQIEYDEKNELGRGGFGVVYLAEYNKRKVALKKFFRFDVTKHDILQEADLLIRLQHQYIVSLIGITSNPSTDDLMLVMEYMEDGSLQELLKDKNAQLTQGDIIQIALDVAEGLQYLHKQKIIHRDLKSENVLLYDGKKRAKLSDFGTVKILTNTAKSHTICVGTLGFMAPEVLENQRYNIKADVYSFGVLIYQMLTGATLGIALPEDERIARIKSNIADEEFRDLVINCCKTDPADRPTISQCIGYLRNVLVSKQGNLNIPIISKYEEAASNEIDEVQALKNISLALPIIPSDQIIKLQKIGEGGLSQFYLATWNYQKVTVKYFKYFEDERVVLKFADLIRRLRHKHIVLYLGISEQPNGEKSSIVMEYMKDGSLYDLLRHNKVKLSRKSSVRITLDVAKALLYLHACGIIHRGMKSSSILLYYNKKRAKLSGFARSRVLRGDDRLSAVGASGYMAPEILHGLPYNSQADVYSFGALMYEIQTNERLPMLFRNDSKMSERVANVADGQFRELITKCCRARPEERPTMKDCVEILQNMKKENKESG